MKRLLASFVLAFALHATAETLAVTGDSLVLAGTAPGNLCYDRVLADSVVVRSTYDPAAAGSITYEANRDYTLDAEHGSLARTADSRIPDFATNVLYGQKNFDHSKCPGYGNGKFFVFVDYQTTHGFPLAQPTDQAAPLSGARKKLDAGGPFEIITYGDSISAGERRPPSLCASTNVMPRALRERFPQAQITVENGATGGDATVQGLARLEEKVLTRKPDLVLVGFGMNDHNIHGVTEEAFEDNLVSIVTQIIEKTGADVLLFPFSRPTPTGCMVPIAWRSTQPPPSAPPPAPTPPSPTSSRSGKNSSTAKTPPASSATTSTTPTISAIGCISRPSTR